MHFALLGNHPDGLAMTAALVASGRHYLTAYALPLPEDFLHRVSAHPNAKGPVPFLGCAPPRRVADLEEILADPAVEAVVVAGSAMVRPVQLRRALQSERHVLCVHPADHTPEIAYEAAMLQNDTKCVLLPLLPEMLHPGVRRLGEFLVSVPLPSAEREPPGEGAGWGAHAPRSPAIGCFRLLMVQRVACREVLYHFEVPGQKPGLPGWDLLRALGGEIAEVSGFAAAEEMEPGREILLAGRFERGGLFQVTLLPNRGHDEWRLTLVGERGQVELYFPRGGRGPAFLNGRGPDGDLREEAWEAWDPWPALVDQFEAALAKRAGDLRLSWQDAIRALELDDAARRSIVNRRSALLEYQEASEEVGFKGTMTLVGCSVLLLSLVLLVLSRWMPQAGWLIVPLLAGFLLLQTLRYLAAKRPEK